MLNARLGFFSPPPEEPTKKWLNCGSIYRTMAVAFTETVLWGLRAHPSVDIVLKTYTQLFPEHQMPGKINTPSSQFKHLFSNVPAHAFINQLAYTFFKMSLQAGLHQTITQAPQLHLNQGDLNHASFLELNFLPLLAEQLGIHIHCYYSQASKSLPRKIEFRPTSESRLTMITSCRYDGQYHTLIRDHKSYQGSLVVPELPYTDTPGIDAISVHFQKIKYQIEEKFQQHFKQFHNWVEAGEITPERLNTWYQLFSTAPQYQGNSVCTPDPEHPILSALAELAAFYPSVKQALHEFIDSMSTPSSTSLVLG